LVVRTGRAGGIGDRGRPPHADSAGFARRDERARHLDDDREDVRPRQRVSRGCGGTETRRATGADRGELLGIEEERIAARPRK
jgi:hypothetical protein